MVWTSVHASVVTISLDRKEVTRFYNMRLGDAFELSFWKMIDTSLVYIIGNFGVNIFTGDKDTLEFLDLT